MKQSIFLFSVIWGTLVLTQCKSVFNITNISALLIGAWAQDENVNVDFVISKKVIYYFDSGYSYNYEIINDTNFVIIDSNKAVLKYKIVKLTNDSLIFKSNNAINTDLIYKYYKR